MDTKGLVDNQLKNYDDKKGLRRRLIGDHEAITKLKNYNKNIFKKYDTDKYVINLTKILLGHEFKKNDKKLSFNIYNRLKSHCAKYYYEKAEKVWLEEQKKQIPIGDRTREYYNTVIKLSHINGEYTNFGKLANSRKVEINKAFWDAFNLKQRQKAEYKHTYATVSFKSYMQNQLPYPKYNWIPNKRITISYSEYETRYNGHLASCNNKIAEYNNLVSELNGVIKNQGSKYTIEQKRKGLSYIEQDLNNLKYDLDKYLSIFEPPYSNK